MQQYFFKRGYCWGGTKDQKLIIDKNIIYIFVYNNMPEFCKTNFLLYSTNEEINLESYKEYPYVNLLELE